MILTGIIDWGDRSIHINGERVAVDEHGGIEINVNVLLESKHKAYATQNFEQKIQEQYTKEQIREVYQLWVESKATTIGDTANVMRIDRQEARKVLDYAVQYQILCRGYNSTWKVIDRIMRDRLKHAIENMEESGKPKKTALDIMRESISTQNTIENDSCVEVEEQAYEPVPPEELPTKSHVQTRIRKNPSTRKKS